MTVSLRRRSPPCYGGLTCAPPRSPEGRRWERYAFGRAMYYKNFYPLPEILGTGFVNGGAFSLYLLPGAP